MLENQDIMTLERQDSRASPAYANDLPRPASQPTAHDPWQYYCRTPDEHHALSRSMRQERIFEMMDAVGLNAILSIAIRMNFLRPAATDWDRPCLSITSKICGLR